jgi:hypothetical protein
MRFRRIPFRSPLLRDCYFFLGVHEMFQFPHLPPTCGGSSRSPGTGLPHSEMMGSRPDCGSSIVSLLVCVLRRLVVPRHPPTAHHVLPGHGVLGGREQCPRHRMALQAGFHCCRPSKNDHNSLMYSQTDEVGKVLRSGNAEPLPPDVCNRCRTRSPLQRGQVAVLVENIPIRPWLSNRISPNGDCWKQSSLERR